jgi:hypothetical protein
MSLPPGIVADAARRAAVLLALTALVAGAVALAAADVVADALRFPFSGIPKHLGEALDILLSNACLLGVALGLSVVVQGLGRYDRQAPVGPSGRAVAALCDFTLAVLVAANLLVVGGAVGAYGWRMVKALLPHGPLELAAFALALALYDRARRGPLGLRGAATTAALAALLLALAALVETYVEV